MTQDTAEIVELFGVRFIGRRNAEGRIYVPVTPESRIGLAELGRVGREMLLHVCPVCDARGYHEANCTLNR